MNNLIVVYEHFTNGYFIEILNLISLLSILSGIYVILTKNPVISVLYLIGLFLGISLYLIILGISFIGLAYLIVYIGAVSILFLFILMLINIRTSELQNDNNNSLSLIITVIFLFYYIFYKVFLYKNMNLYMIFTYFENIYSASGTSDYNSLLFVSSQTWDGFLVQTDHITSIGNVMYTYNNIWLIMASFILLLAMVGSIVITIKQTNK
jgi:NADH-ubiquinone oxidoreductase chain 6